MRRLPIYLLLDVSESMAGDNLRQLQQGLGRLVQSLRTDPHALETVHLSVIAFAGQVRTLAPLTELGNFYTPHLPIGAGTSLGAALMHLMDEIERNVVRGSAEKKGDWRPVVYLMTDGKPTDELQPAIERWKQDFAKRVTLVAIGIGLQASLQNLSQLTEHILQLDAQNEDDFKRFVDWVTQSVAAQSRSVSVAQSTGVSLAKRDVSLLKTLQEIEQAAHVDEDFVILSARCQSNHLPYLIKYERVSRPLQNLGFAMNVDNYVLSGVFALEEDYFQMSDQRALARTVHSDSLLGSPGCPHCGNPIGFAMCICGQIMCLRGPGPAICPSCGQSGNFGFSEGEGFEVSRSRG